MSTPYHFTPRGPPLVPHSTPLSATAHGFAKQKTSRAPIINPYQKFPQDEFDAWIGGITNALRTALGQEEEHMPPSVTQDQNPLEEHAAIANGDVTPQYRTLEQDSDNDEVPDDSFADIKARRAKGKARDPREGPGLGATGSDPAQPITLDFSDEEEDQIAEGLTMVHDEESEEEQEEEQEEEEEENEDNEESEGSEEDYQWDRGQSSSQILSARTTKIGPPRKIRHPDEYPEGAADDDEVIEEDSEEDYDDEHSEDEEEQEYPSHPPITNHSSATEVIDILDSDEEEAAQAQQPRSSPPQENFEDEYYDEEAGEEGYDDEYSEDDEEDNENHSFRHHQPAPPRRSLLADYRARHTREPSYDDEEEEGSYDEDEEEGSYHGEETRHQLHQDKSAALGGDSWSRHEDLESDQEQYFDQNRQAHEGGFPDHWEDESKSPVAFSNQTLPHQPTGELEVDRDDDESPNRYTGFPAREPHFSPPPIDSLAPGLPDPWIGPKTYAEDYHGSGDIEPVRRNPEAIIDPSLLGVEDTFGGDELLEDSASGIGAFLTPGALTPNESEILSGVGEHASVTPDGGAEDHLYAEQPRWGDQWQTIQSYPPNIQESSWDGSIAVPQPLRRGEIPRGAEIITLDDSDEEQGTRPGDMEKGDDGIEMDEEHDQLQEEDSGIVFNPTAQVAQTDAFEDMYGDNLVISPPDELSSKFLEGTSHPDDAHGAIEDTISPKLAEILPSPSATPPPIDESFHVDAKLDNVYQPEATKPSEAFQNPPPEVLNILNDSIYHPQPLFAPTYGRHEAVPETEKVEEDNFDDVYGSPVPLPPTQPDDAEKNDTHHDTKEKFEVTHESPGTSNAVASEADNNLVSDSQDESHQPGTAKAVAEHLSQLGNLGELPTPPWERVQSTGHEPTVQSSENYEDAAQYKASVEDVSDDEGDADSVPPGPDAVDLDIEMEENPVNQVAYTVLEGEDGDADGEAEDDTEVISTFSVSEHESDMNKDAGTRYFVEEPVTDGRLTEDPADRAVSIDVESIYPERSVTPVGLREAVQGMGEPSKAEIIRPSQGLSKQPSLPEINSEVSDSIAMSPKTDQFATVRSDVPMPITADASVPDPTDSPHSPIRPPRTFILSLTGTPKFILSPANSPRPAGNPIPVSVSLPPSILKALREGSAEPMNTTLYPFPPGLAVHKPDGLFTPAGASTSTATPTEMEHDEAKKQALIQIADAIYEAVPDENLTEWPGFDLVTAQRLEDNVALDEGLNLLPTATTDIEEEDVEKAKDEEVENEEVEEEASNKQMKAGEPSSETPIGSLDDNTRDGADSAMLLSPSLPYQAPTMHLPTAREPADPILMADPYPYSLSTPGAFLQGSEEEVSDEDIAADSSLSSTSTAEKVADIIPANEVDATTSNSQDPFDYQESAPPELFADVFESFQHDAEFEAVEDGQQHPEIGNDKTQFKDFQEILEAEDPFKLMGTDSTVAPGEVKDNEKTPSNALDSPDATPQVLQNKPSNAGIVIKETSPPVEPAPEPDTIRPTQRGAKRKRSSSGKAESSSNRKRGRPKGKAKEQEPSPERPEEDTIHVRPRTAVTSQQNSTHQNADKSFLNGHSSSATRTLSGKKQGSRASSIASSVPSDKSLAIQPSPTTKKPFDFHVPDAAHVHYKGLLFHAHGNRRKNPYSQPITQPKEALVRPTASRNPSTTQNVEQSKMSGSPPVSRTENRNENETVPATTLTDNSVAEEPSTEHSEAIHDHAENRSTSRERPITHSSDNVIGAKGVTAASDTPPLQTSANSPQVSPPFSPAHPFPITQPSSAARSTRSQCKFHKISLPREKKGPRVYFVVPGCTLANLQLLQEKHIEDLGQATSAEGNRMVGHIENLDFNLQLIGVIRQLVGVDIIRENAVYYLPPIGETWRHQSPQKSQGAKAHNLHSSPAISGSTHSSSIGPPVSNADSTSTTLSARRRITEAEERSRVSSTESEPEDSEDDYKPTGKRAKPSPSEARVLADGQELTTSQPKRGRGRPRKIKAQDMAYKPEIDEPDDGSPKEGSSKRSKRTRRGVKRNWTTDAMMDEGEERKSKKLKSHNTVPGSFSPHKAAGQLSAQSHPPTK